MNAYNLAYRVHLDLLISAEYAKRTIPMYTTAFKDFMNDEDEVQQAILLATRQTYGGTPSAVIELFDDGTWRVLSEVGNLYRRTHSILIAIPWLSQDDDETDDSEPYFENAIETLRRNFEEVNS